MKRVYADANPRVMSDNGPRFLPKVRSKPLMTQPQPFLRGRSLGLTRETVGRESGSRVQLPL